MLILIINNFFLQKPHCCKILLLFTTFLLQNNIISQSFNLTNNIPTIPVKIDFSNSFKESDFLKLGEGIGKAVSASLKNVGNAFSNGTSEWEDNMRKGGKNLADGQIAFWDETAKGSEASAQHIRRVSKSYIGSFFHRHDIAEYAINIGIGFAISASLYFVTRFLWNVFENVVLQKMREPKVLINKKMGLWDRIKAWFKNEEKPTMILDDAVKERLLKLIQTTRKTNIRLRKTSRSRLSYRNILLWGPPGTGKTMFARLLARESGMDFAETTGGAFFQDGAGIAAIDNLFDWAENSRAGLVIFIDEADSLFVDRTLLTPGSLEHRIVNHFLNRLGQASNKFLFIGATNHKVILDHAMQRRIQELIYMPLPSLKTRKELITFKTKELLEINEYSPAIKDSISKLFYPERINFIAQLINGFSHADIASTFEIIKSEIEMLEESGDDNSIAALIEQIVTDTVNKQVQKMHEFGATKYQQVATPA